MNIQEPASFHLIAQALAILFMVGVAYYFLRELFSPQSNAPSSTQESWSDTGDDHSRSLSSSPFFRLSLTNLTCWVILFGLGYGWWEFGSFDKAILRLFPQASPSDAAPIVRPIDPHLDSVVVDGLRWFKIVGTDSAGVGYGGWVSELAILPAPPAPGQASTAMDILRKKMGMPTMGESVQAAKQIKNLSKTLHDANRHD